MMDKLVTNIMRRHSVGSENFLLNGICRFTNNYIVQNFYHTYIGLEIVIKTL